ncbi:MAG: tetratricopeptide repeat protein [Bacteroidales bacterium]
MYNKFSTSFYFIISLVFLISACNNEVQKTIVNPGNEVNHTIDAFPADSFAFYENVLIKDSLNKDLHLAIATNYYAEKQFDKAIEHLLTVCRLDAKNLIACITLGNIYYDTKQDEKAIMFYEKALLLDQENVNVRCDLATSYLNLKNAEKSLILLKENIKMEPKHAQSHHNLSLVFSQLGKTKEAEAEMKIFNELNK